MMAAWLDLDGHESSEAHMSPFVVNAISLEDRQLGRVRVRGAAGGPGLLDFERPKRLHETEEPTGMP